MYLEQNLKTLGLRYTWIYSEFYEVKELRLCANDKIAIKETILHTSASFKSYNFQLAIFFLAFILFHHNSMTSYTEFARVQQKQGDGFGFLYSTQFDREFIEEHTKIRVNCFT